MKIFNLFRVADDPQLIRDRQRLSDLKQVHKNLKELVSKIEKEEARSLQIYAVAKALGEALSWKDMAPRLTTGVQKLFGAYEYLLYAYDEQQGWTQLHRRGSWSKDPPIDDHVPEETLFIRPPRTEEVVPVLVIPVFSFSNQEKQLSGVLFIKYPGGHQSEEDMIATGREFGTQLGMGLYKARLFSQMELSSKVDGLTQVFRRQAFMDRLSEELKRAAVFHTPFSVMMLDIDHFKAVNDGHGHAAGDAVLARVAEVLKMSVYETDVVGRYGGEEFIILFPKAEPQGVLRKAELLRKTIENEIITSGFEKLQITVSIGVAHYPHHGNQAIELIERADQALYKAKESGRNQVVEAP